VVVAVAQIALLTPGEVHRRRSLTSGFKAAKSPWIRLAEYAWKVPWTNARQTESDVTQSVDRTFVPIRVLFFVAAESSLSSRFRSIGHFHSASSLSDEEGSRFYSARSNSAK
jgi:hypothetical protein